MAPILLEDSMGPGVDTDVIELDSRNLLRGALYSEYVARWMTWAAGTWTDKSEHGTDLRKEIILQVAPMYYPGHDPKSKMYDRFTPSPPILKMLEQFK